MSATEFFWYNDTLNLCQLAMFFQNQFILELVRPLACSFEVFHHIHVIIANLIFQIINPFPHNDTF